MQKLAYNTSNKLPYCVALECLDWSVLAKFTHMNAHVCAAGGKRVVALPVHIQSWSCRFQTETLFKMCPDKHFLF